MAQPISAAVIRIPKSAYFVVLFLVFCVAPIGLYGGAEQPNQARLSVLSLVFLIPILAGLYIARTSTFVNSDGLVVRAIFGRRVLPWANVRGLSVSGHSVYAVLEDGGAVRLPAVRVRHLSLISTVSGGHLPEIPPVKLIPAPSPRRR